MILVKNARSARIAVFLSGSLLLLSGGAWAQQTTPAAPAEPTSPDPGPNEPAPNQPVPPPAQDAPAQAPATQAPAGQAPATQAPAAQPVPASQTDETPPAAEPSAPPVDEGSDEPVAELDARATMDAEGAPVAEAGEAPEEPGGLSLMAFADAYYSYNTQQPGTAQPYHRAYDQYNGFSLSWLGLDVGYDGGELGVTASLRMGTGNAIFFGGNTATAPFTFFPLTQGYATWRPHEAVELDAGMFGTIFGAEVLESWMNLNYTRGALYYAMQPFWHTGLRGSFSVTESLSFKAMVVNGTNEMIAPNNKPAVAAQVAFAPVDEFALAAGYMHDFDPTRSVFDEFIDVVATVSLGDLSIIGNFDYNIDQPGDNGGDSTAFWGVSGAVGYALTDTFGVAVRGEYLKDDGNGLWLNTSEPLDPAAPELGFAVAEDNSLVTGTLTLDFKPVGDNLVIRWDNRIETSDQDIFFERGDEPDPTDFWYNSILGVVVKTE